MLHIAPSSAQQTAQAPSTTTVRHSQGFSLIELLVVITIMGLLIGLIGPQILGRVDKARVTTAKADLATLSQALDMYKLDNHRYPTTDQGLEALVQQPTNSPVPKNWNPEGYLQQANLPQDPWGGDYQYISPGENNRPYEIYTLGNDGQIGGEGYDADLSNWDE